MFGYFFISLIVSAFLIVYSHPSQGHMSDNDIMRILHGDEEAEHSADLLVALLANTNTSESSQEAANMTTQPITTKSSAQATTIRPTPRITSVPPTTSTSTRPITSSPSVQPATNISTSVQSTHTQTASFTRSTTREPTIKTDRTESTITESQTDFTSSIVSGSSEPTDYTYSTTGEWSSRTDIMETSTNELDISTDSTMTETNLYPDTRPSKSTIPTGASTHRLANITSVSDSGTSAQMTTTQPTDSGMTSTDTFTDSIKTDFYTDTSSSQSSIKTTASTDRHASTHASTTTQKEDKDKGFGTIISEKIAEGDPLAVTVLVACIVAVFAIIGAIIIVVRKRKIIAKHDFPFDDHYSDVSQRVNNLYRNGPGGGDVIPMYIKRNKISDFETTDIVAMETVNGTALPVAQQQQQLPSDSEDEMYDKMVKLDDSSPVVFGEHARSAINRGGDWDRIDL